MNICKACVLLVHIWILIGATEFMHCIQMLLEGTTGGEWSTH